MDSGVAGAGGEWSQWDFIDAFGDGVYGADADGRCIFVNKAAIRILGYSRADELLGHNMHGLIHHTRPDGSAFPQAECPLLHTATSGHPVRLDNEMLWRRDGTPFFAEYSSFPVRSGDGKRASVITFNDTSVRQDAQKRLAVQYTVSQVLAGSGSLESTAERLLEAIGTGLDWDVGVLWVCERPDFGQGRMQCLAEWRSRDMGALQQASRLGDPAALASEAGHAGRSGAVDAPVHIPDLAAAAPGGRRADAMRQGLRSSFAFPVMDGRVAVGAIEFFARRRIDVDDGLLEAVSTLGQQIGQMLERRHASDALRESETLKGAILASSPDCVITVDGEGRIVEFNETASRTFGRKAEEVIGQDMIATIFPPDTRESHMQAFTHALQGALPAARRIEVDALRHDGTVFPIEFTYSQTAVAPRARYTAYLRDITLRRREQAWLRESEARFRIIANAIPQLSWMTGPDGAITWYNQRWYDYTGTVFADMAGWGWRTVHHPDHLERVEQRLRESFRTGEPWEDTFPLRAADGGYNWFLSRAVPIREQSDDDAMEGRIVGWFGTNTDITSLREAEQTLEAARDEAEAANRAKSTFIANMSHELRTPLSAIIGYAEMLVEEIEDGTEPVDLARDVQKIEGNARHLLGLINDVLDLSKVESGKMEAFAETFDIAAMAAEVASTVSALMEKKANRLDLRLGPDLGVMHSDVTRIRQVLLNLLSNAAKFTEGGTITLSAEREPGEGGADWIAFAVADTGIGMTEEQLAKLFQRFQQADASTTRQFGGTGLGLALTKAFATLLGGEVDVRSDVGQGSTFRVRLPATLAPEAPPEAAETGRHAETAGRDVVLVVDDDPVQRDLMGRFLAREGYAARTAPDGRTGLDLARQLRPQAILLDVTMPGMDGWSVLSALKADPELAPIPVVMVTFMTERALAASLGAADYVVKPVNWERLRHVMERFRDAEGDVLVVDDEADTRHRTRQALEKNGWTVVEAADGREALAHVAHSIPRVILLDLNMPVMDGFDFLARLRERPECAAVPVVVLTALDLTADDRRRLRGANQVLNKGNTSMRDLAATLHELGAAIGKRA